MELLKKLKINSEKPLWTVNMPERLTHAFAGVEIRAKVGKEKPVHQLILFALDSKELVHELHKLAAYISPDTLFWICYPKKSGAISSDLILMKSWDVVFNSGYRGQSSAAIDNDWSALRVTNAPRKTPSDCDIPMEERIAEGIDYKNRTVQLPVDAQAAVDKHKGMSDFFQAMAFTHKKEYVMAITDAKKEETRKRRIEKTVAMLQEKMMQKDLKSSGSAAKAK